MMIEKKRRINDNSYKIHSISASPFGNKYFAEAITIMNIANLLPALQYFTHAYCRDFALLQIDEYTVKRIVSIKSSLKHL